jgi:serine/threonine protein kinase
MTEWIHQQVGDCKIIEYLGDGELGQVFRAYNRFDGVERAIKVFHLHVTQEPGFVKKIPDTYNLRVARIIPIVQFGTYQDVARNERYFVETELFATEKSSASVNPEKKEWLGSRSLLTLLKENRSVWSLPRIIRIIRDAAFALDAAHQQGFVHGNLKSGNLLVRSRNALNGTHPWTDVDLAISDAGLYREYKHASQYDREPRALMLDTLKYASPEWFQGQPLDQRSDIYALGIMLYQLVTDGLAPFDFVDPEGQLTQSMMAAKQHCEVAPPALAERSTGSSLYQLPALEGIIQTCLHKPKEARYQRMRELGEALDALLRHLGNIDPTPFPRVWVAWAGPSGLTDADGETHTRHPGNQYVAESPKKLTGKGIRVRRFDSDSQPDPADLFLNDPDILPDHIQINWNDEDVDVTLLHQHDQTFLGGESLKPHDTSPWTAQQPLQIGQYILYLEVPDNLSEINGYASTAHTSFEESELAQEQAFVVKLEILPATLRLRPGQSAEFPLIIHNETSQNQEIRLGLARISDIHGQDKSLQLYFDSMSAEGTENVFPKQQQHRTCSLSIAEEWQSLAGYYQVHFMAEYLRGARTEYAQARVNLIIEPFSRSSVNVIPGTQAAWIETFLWPALYGCGILVLLLLCWVYILPFGAVTFWGLGEHSVQISLGYVLLYCCLRLLFSTQKQFRVKIHNEGNAAATFNAFCQEEPADKVEKGLIFKFFQGNVKDRTATTPRTPGHGVPGQTTHSRQADNPSGLRRTMQRVRYWWWRRKNWDRLVASGATVTIQPGQERNVAMRVMPQRRHLFGKIRSHDFTVHVKEHGENTEKQRGPYTLRYTAFVFPRWLEWTIFGMLLGCILFWVIWRYLTATPPIHAAALSGAPLYAVLATATITPTATPPPTPTVTPEPTATPEPPTSTALPPPSSTARPTSTSSPTQTPSPTLTLTPSITPTPLPYDFVCQPGRRYTIRGNGPPNSSVLLYFDPYQEGQVTAGEMAVGGKNIDRNGYFSIPLIVDSSQAPGLYTVTVRVRGTGEIVEQRICEVPETNTPTPAVTATIP